VVVDGEPVLYLERGGKAIVTLPAFDEPEMAALAVGAMAAAMPPGGRGLRFERIDAVEASKSPRAEAFVEAGFTTGYRGLSYHPSPQREVALARGR
jgi:ATP-dependent Lhr-like helicase